jgi:hypothetical protein
VLVGKIGVGHCCEHKEQLKHKPAPVDSCSGANCDENNTTIPVTDSFTAPRHQPIKLVAPARGRKRWKKKKKGLDGSAVDGSAIDGAAIHDGSAIDDDGSIVDDFVAAPHQQPVKLSEQAARKRKSRRKKIQLSEPAGDGFDGLICFPTYAAGVCTSFRYLDTCSLGAQKEQNVPAVPHCVIRPEDAARLCHMTPSPGRADVYATFRTTLPCVNPVSKESQLFKTRFIILNPLPMNDLVCEKGSNITTSEEVQKYTRFMHDTEMIKERHKHKTDIVLLLGRPPLDCQNPGGDLHILDMRWLCFETLAIARTSTTNGVSLDVHDLERNATYRYIRQFMTHDGYSVARRGGSNGAVSTLASSNDACKAFRSFMHVPGK